MLFFSKKIFLADHLEGLVDIHNHILPAIDDGSPDMETSMKMIDLYKDLGFTGCIATPHTMEDYYGNDAQKIKTVYNQTAQKLESSNHRGFIKSVASEYMMDDGFETILETANYLNLFENYLLVELSYFQPPVNLTELLFDMRSKNDLNPILAHPERYRYFGSSKIENLIDRGCDLQLNLLSLSDHYGKDAFAKAEKYLLSDLYQFIGTDAHKPEHLSKLKEITLKKKHLESIKKLMENHQSYNFIAN